MNFTHVVAKENASVIRAADSRARALGWSKGAKSSLNLQVSNALTDSFGVGISEVGTIAKDILVPL